MISSIQLAGLFSELEKVARAEPQKMGPLYTRRQLDMVEELPGGTASVTGEEDIDIEKTPAFKRLEKTPKWRREVAIANTGVVPFVGGTALGALGGGIAGFKAGNYLGGRSTPTMLGAFAGGLLGMGGGSAIRDRMVDRARVKYDARRK